MKRFLIAIAAAGLAASAPLAAFADNGGHGAAMDSRHSKLDHSPYGAHWAYDCKNYAPQQGQCVSDWVHMEKDGQR